MPPLVREALARYRLSLESRYGTRLREIVLFGSYARGQAHDESDVDVLVVVEGLTDLERVDIIDRAYFADWADGNGVGLSPLVYGTDQAAAMRRGGRRLFRDIDREGVAL